MMIVTYKIEISIFAKECKIYVYIIKKSKFYELFFFSIIKQITIIKKNNTYYQFSYATLYFELFSL